MSAGGKGSSPRPFDVAFEQYAANFDQIFRKSKNVLPEKAENTDGTPESPDRTQAGRNSSGDCSVLADNQSTL